MKRLIIVLLIIIYPLILFSVQDAGRENIFDYGAGARAMGLGNSYVSIADDSSALYWNPGGLGILEYNELMFLHTTLFESTYYDFLSFCYPTIDFGTFGLGIFRIGTGDIIFRDSHNITVSEENSLQQMQFIIGYGLKMNLPFGFGTAIKVNTFRLGDYNDANISFDFGLLIPFYGKTWRRTFSNFQIQNFNLGINFKNIISTPIKLETEAEGDELNIKPGISYFIFIDKKQNHKILATFDLNLYANRDLKINSGLEYRIYKLIFLRGGFNQNIGVVTGGGVEYWNLRLDYSLGFQEINNTHRISLLWRFGQSVEQQRIEKEERIRIETEERVKIAVEEKTKEYQDRIKELEDQYEEEAVKKIADLTNRYIQEREALLEESRLKSEEEKQKLMDDLGKKYEQEKIKAVSALTNQFNQEKKKLTEELDQKLKTEKSKLKKQLIADEQFKRKHYNKGMEYFEKADYDSAITEFQSVVRFDPNYVEAEKYLKRARAAKRKPTTYSKKIMDLYYKGIDFYVAGEYKKAINIWKKILKIDPYNKLALRNITDAEKKLAELNKIKKSRKKKK